jgi:hypothetical protein
MPDDFKSIKDVFITEPELKKIRSIIGNGDVVNDFENIFPEFKKVVKAIKADRGVLTLKSDNAAWRNELKLKEKEIIDKINLFYKEERINRIKFSAK